MSKALKDALAEPKRFVGAPMPLFDRLLDNDPDTIEEYPVKRYYNRFELIQSIEQEVSRILNTRATAKRTEQDSLSLEPLSKGLPECFGLMDFSQYDGANPGDWDRISKICVQAINRYEPRLKSVAVTVTAFDRKTQSLQAVIQAVLAMKEIQGEVTFPVEFGEGER
jgi:type VI secretion system lysozyme-like protein